MEATRERLVSDFKVLINDAEELLKVTTGQAGEAIDTVRRRIEQSLEEGKQSLAEAEVILLNKGRDAGEPLERREHRGGSGSGGRPAHAAQVMSAQVEACALHTLFEAISAGRRAARR